jgi:hypothetical protein
MRGSVGCLIVLVAVVAAGFFFGRDYVRRHPEDVPWTRLELGDRIGRFTAGKISKLGAEPAQCRSLLADAGTGDSAAPNRSDGADCGYEDGVRLGSAEDGRALVYRPAPLVTSCPIAAALHLWETRIVQPAARAHFGSSVERVTHAGSYSCRRLYGREAGDYSEHATADAFDVTGFALGTGERIDVARDWGGTGPEAEFLRDVRDGACGLFSTVLSPDYNEAHRDHLHFDVADRGGGPWTVCR